jgi:3-methyladenine DNA glycosylase AlkD
VLLTEVLAQLEAAGSEQTRKTYARHGIRGECFGVSYAVLGQLRKKIKVDDSLALELWASGIHDARILACMVMDTNKITRERLDAMVDVIDNYALAGELGDLIARSPLLMDVHNTWRFDAGEWRSAIGWRMVSAIAAKGDVSLDAGHAYLAEIEAGVASAPNRTRLAMNSALIALGGHNVCLYEDVVACSGRIGPIQVDHGDTGCKTPDPVVYMHKMRARQKV